MNILYMISREKNNGRILNHNILAANMADVILNRLCRAKDQGVGRALSHPSRISDEAGHEERIQIPESSRHLDAQTILHLLYQRGDLHSFTYCEQTGLHPLSTIAS